MIYFICSAIFLQTFINVAVGLTITSVPQIYPQKSHVVVDAHTDLVLGCRGAEPMRWTFYDDVNSLYYNSSYPNITYMNNTNELEYKFETILIVYNVSHVNVGFYYCHGEKTDFDTSRRSSRIYVFVHDDNNLSVIASQQYDVLRSYGWFFAIPCRPTSPDISITLTCYDVKMSVIPSNYSKVQQTEDYSVQFHPYDGFTARTRQTDYFFLECRCLFRREDKTFLINIRNIYNLNYYQIDQPLIEGTNIVNMGDNLTLQCSLLVGLYYPYYKYGLRWVAPSNGNPMVTYQYSINLEDSVLLISMLTIKNVSIGNERYYRCYGIDFCQINANIYVAVHDKQVNQSPPRIYSPDPSQEEIQVNSGDNITLRCEGSRPVRWSFHTKKKPYSNKHIRNLENGLYNSELSMVAVRYTDTGFYYCHEKDSVRDHPLKSNNIYIFVKDEQNLHVPENERPYYAFDNMTVPCRPTSRDVNVTLSVRHRIYNVNIERYKPARNMDPVIYAYDPRVGFSVQIPQAGAFIATCTFKTETANSTLELNYNIDWNYQLTLEPHIKGPFEDLVFVGETLELSCTVTVHHNVSNDALRWRILNNSSLRDVTIERINVPHGKVLISKLFIYNVKNIDEGRYICDLLYNNATANKFISVYDKFEVKPFIKNLTYHYAYIGKPLVLHCGVNISHNVGFNMTWTAPNSTNKHIIYTEYILEVRHRQDQILLKIDNVTYENEGNYSCFVSDLTNRKEIVTKYVQVKRGKVATMKIAPNHMNNPKEIDVQIGETTKLTCPAEGDPKPTITWMKGSTRIQSLSQHINFSADNSELTIFFAQRLDAGLYTCIARNPYGEVSYNVYLRVKSVSFSGAMIAGIICMTTAVIVVAVAFAKFEYKKKRRRRALLEDGLDNIKFIEVEQMVLSTYDTSWEIPRNKIKLGRNLGSGYFGLVVEATVSNYFDEEPVKTVAVKMLHQNSNIAELHSLISELNILGHLGEHANLINLLGACTANIARRNLFIVIEYCKHGSLRSYLLENRSNFVNLIDPDTELITLSNVEASICDTEPVTTLELVRWALQVARGMEFLASKKVVHGDLAARNVLLTENYVVKISDFGLSRNLNSNDYYRKRSQCLLPVKWMALESIRDKTFSSWSDLWSFGVVLWELFSLARTPYAELEADFRFYRKLESGYRLDQPQYSTREIYQVMRECWCAQPQSRPTFTCLVRTLDDLLKEVYTRCVDSQHHYVNVQDWLVLDI